MSLSAPEPFIEALIFASEKSITAEEIQQVLAELSEEPLSVTAIQGLIEQIRQKYLDLNLAIELVQLISCRFSVRRRN
jgi:segregation and condensation protein B